MEQDGQAVVQRGANAAVADLDFLRRHARDIVAAADAVVAMPAAVAGPFLGLPEVAFVVVKRRVSAISLAVDALRLPRVLLERRPYRKHRPLRQRDEADLRRVAAGIT